MNQHPDRTQPRFSMVRATTIVALVLALLAGIVLGHLTAVDSTGVTPAVSERRTDRVRQFYDGINRYLSTGDDAVFQMLAPGFQEFSTLGGNEGSASTLLERLDTFRRSANPPRFTIEEMHELGSLVEVRVSTGIPTTVDLAGLSVTTALPASMIEFVQLQGDAIVAHWGQGAWVPNIGQTLDTPLSLDAARRFAFDLGRVALDPGAELELPPTVAAWLLVETGHIAFDDGVTRLRLESGGSRTMTGSGRARIHNPESGQAVVWLASLKTPSSASDYEQGHGEVPPGVTITPVAWGSQFEADAFGRVRIRLARATVPPGSRIVRDDAGYLSAIAVVDGQVDVTVQDGTAFHCRADGLAATLRGHESIPAGDGVATLPGATLSYRVTGSAPATLLVLTILPAD
jgi:hypothetical protein